MSQQETITGKLKLIPKLEGGSLEDQCKRVYNERFERLCCLPTGYESWEEIIYCRGDNSILVCNGNVYEVISKRKLDCLDLFQITKSNDGTYDFTLSYYNGGCSFSEAIEYAFDNMEEEGK
jgi:hypothetical protein